MRTENSGDYLDISMNPTIPSLQHSAGMKQETNITHPTTWTYAVKGKLSPTLTFRVKPLNTFYSHAKVANQRESIRFNPLGKYPKWSDAEYRQAYLVASIEQGIAWQIKINRKRRNLSQESLANMIGTQQSAISRLEDPTYGSHSIETLIQIANAFDCALSIKLIPYSRLSIESADLSQDALFAESYENEIKQLAD